MNPPRIFPTLRSRLVLAIATVALGSTGLIAQELTSTDLKTATTFVQLLRNRDAGELARISEFPLRRRFPLPPVRDAADFVKRFSVLFDDALIQKITEAPVKGNWEATVAWRGLMGFEGMVYLNENGGIRTLNAECAAEKAAWTRAVDADRARLHPSLRKYESPLWDARTKAFHIRVDDLGGYSLRYAAWPAATNTLTLPSLVLTNGYDCADGDGGNHSFVFANGNYYYVVEVVVMGEADAMPGSLKVF